MLRGLAAVVVALLLSGAALAEPRPTWVFLRDKGVAAGELTPELARRASHLAPRSLERRRRVRGDAGVDLRDVDLFAPYVARVLATGALMRSSSRWLNALSVIATNEQLAALEALDCVVGTRPVAARRQRRRPVDRDALVPRSTTGEADETDATHGIAEEQLAVVGVPELHDCGLDGTGVIVGVLDSGFLLDHEAFATLDVVAERDFLNDDDVTRNEAGDPDNQHDHGTWVLSQLAGWDPGDYAGVAPRIAVLLAKVEDTSQEQPIEEDWWIEGLEWVEAGGAELVTSSIGFIDWYTPDELDGATAPTSQAAKVAVDNGLILVNAAGNSGPAATTIVAPADTDGVIAVGAVDVDGVLADFSSRGPTADGRIKPDLCAVGVDNWLVQISSTDGYVQHDGTSFAAPMLAGVVALLLQAFPETPPAEMLELLASTATQADSPDDDLGYGVVDGAAAAGLYCTCWDDDEDGHYDEACGGDDCDDDDGSVHPAAAERCSGVDDDCDGELMAGEEDDDGDGYLACDDDCDDEDAEVHPGAIEICDDRRDDDCDGAVDVDDEDCPAPASPASTGADAEGSCDCRLGQSPARRAAPFGLLAALLAASLLRRRLS